MNNIICADFDGVLHKCSKGYGNGVIYDIPTENSQFTIKNLIRGGFKVLVFTSRDKRQYPKIRAWLEKNGFPKLEITNVKPKGALAFIDDRAIRFTSWADIVHYFL